MGAQLVMELSTWSHEETKKTEVKEKQRTSVLMMKKMI